MSSDFLQKYCTFISFKNYSLKTLKQCCWAWKHLQKAAISPECRLWFVHLCKGIQAWEFFGSGFEFFTNLWLFIQNVKFHKQFCFDFAIIREGTIIPRTLSIRRTKISCQLGKKLFLKTHMKLFWKYFFFFCLFQSSRNGFYSSF